MRVVALISGGKDSCYNMMQCVSEGHEIVALANLKPKEKDELDSYMYQTVGHHAIDMYAEAMGLPLFRRVIEGTSVEQGRDYQETPLDEVEDMYELLKEIKVECDVEAVSVGAILSDYQRVRVEHVCMRLGLTPLAYLWRRDQRELLEEMIACDVKAIIIKVAAMGLDPDQHLGQSLAEIQPHMLRMSTKYGLNVCGEGGEYETFTYDCPLFHKSISIDSQEVIVHSADAFAPVAFLNLTAMHLTDKQLTENDLYKRLLPYPMKRSSDLTSQLLSLDSENDPKKTLVAHESRIQHSDAPNGVLPFCTTHRDGAVYISQIAAQVSIGNESTTELVTKAMETLKGLVLSRQLEMSHLFAVHLYVRDMSEFAAINAVYKTYFSINPPIRVCVQACLPSNITLLLDAVAKIHPERNTMHVQGISHWAPANIGPYSQAVKAGRKLFIAGQIPLNPGCMSIVSQGIHSQARLALQHVHSVLLAMKASGADPYEITMAICYLTQDRFIPVALEEWEHKMEDTCSDERDAVQPLFVVVPALPRGALIEWHVQAAEKTDVDSHKSSATQHEGFLLTCDFKLRSYEQEDDGNAEIDKYLNLTVHAVSTGDVKPDQRLVSSITHSLCQALKSGTDNLGVDASEVLLTLRVFIRADVDLVQEEYRRSYMDVFGCDEASVLPVAIIPVLSLFSPRHLMSVCQ